MKHLVRTAFLVLCIAAAAPVSADWVDEELAKAATLLHSGDRTASKTSLQSSYAFALSMWGDTHLNTAEIAIELANLLFEDGEYSPAEPLLRQTVAVYEREWGPQDMMLVDALMQLGEILAKTGRAAEAEPVLKRSAAILLEQTGRANPQYEEATRMLAALYVAQGKQAQAEALESTEIAFFDSLKGGSSGAAPVVVQPPPEVDRIPSGGSPAKPGAAAFGGTIPATPRQACQLFPTLNLPSAFPFEQPVMREFRGKVSNDYWYEFVSCVRRWHEYYPGNATKLVRLPDTAIPEI